MKELNSNFHTSEMDGTGRVKERKQKVKTDKELSELQEMLFAVLQSTWITTLTFFYATYIFQQNLLI